MFKKCQTVIEQYLNSIQTVLLLFYCCSNSVYYSSHTDLLLFVKLTISHFLLCYCSNAVLSLFVNVFKHMCLLFVNFVVFSNTVVNTAHILLFSHHFLWISPPCAALAPLSAEALTCGAGGQDASQGRKTISTNKQ